MDVLTPDERIEVANEAVQGGREIPLNYEDIHNNKLDWLKRCNRSSLYIAYALGLDQEDVVDIIHHYLGL